MKRHIVNRSVVWLVLATAAACQHSQRAPVASQSALAAPSLELDVTIRPVRDGGTEVTAAAVREEIRGAVDQSIRPLSLRVGIV